MIDIHGHVSEEDLVKLAERLQELKDRAAEVAVRQSQVDAEMVRRKSYIDRNCNPLISLIKSQIEAKAIGGGGSRYVLERLEGFNIELTLKISSNSLVVSHCDEEGRKLSSLLSVTFSRDSINPNQVDTNIEINDDDEGLAKFQSVVSRSDDILKAIRDQERRLREEERRRRLKAQELQDEIASLQGQIAKLERKLDTTIRGEARRLGFKFDFMPSVTLQGAETIATDNESQTEEAAEDSVTVAAA